VLIPIELTLRARLIARNHLLEARMAEMLGVPHPAEFPDEYDPA